MILLISADEWGDMRLQVVMLSWLMNAELIVALPLWLALRTVNSIVTFISRHMQPRRAFRSTPGTADNAFNDPNQCRVGVA
ncbi:MAG: hypothetical protein KGO02_21710 [Alphaproteobacteria bacterium]|nr:hypothetical protein [Alphaproteobacteria bacterium]